jgi:hypothetical protein
MAGFMDDYVYSLLRYLQLAEDFTCKDLTGAAETVTGSFATLFPGVEFVVLRQYDLESLPRPCLGVGVQIIAVPRERGYCWNRYEHEGGIMAIGTVFEAEQPDYDRSVNQTLQMQNALVAHFDAKDAAGLPSYVRVPWYRYQYNPSGDEVYVGELLVREFRVFPVDDFHLGARFTLEVFE